MTGAQSAIEKALLTLYEEKEVYQISVNELTTKANVARSEDKLRNRLFEETQKNRLEVEILVNNAGYGDANGVGLVKDAKHIMTANDEILCSKKKAPVNRIRYQHKWWEECHLEGFDWNDEEGPFNKAFDLFGDGSVKLINIPGHCDGLCAVKVKNEDGKYVLIFSDGGYATKSWKDMTTSGVCMDKKAQRISLGWIREQSMNEKCGYMEKKVPCTH